MGGEIRPRESADEIAERLVSGLVLTFIIVNFAEAKRGIGQQGRLREAVYNGLIASAGALVILLSVCLFSLAKELSGGVLNGGPLTVALGHQDTALRKSSQADQQEKKRPQTLELTQLHDFIPRGCTTRSQRER